MDIVGFRSMVSSFIVGQTVTAMSMFVWNA